MKILHINKKYSDDGGSSIYLLDVMRQLQARGHSNVVVYESTTGLRSEAATAISMPEVIAFSLRKPRRSLAALSRLIEDENPDLIHIHDISNFFTVALCAANRPTMRTLHDHTPFCPSSIRYYRNSGNRCDRAFGPYCFYSAYANWCNSRSPGRVASTYINSYREIGNKAIYRKVIVASRYMREQLLLNGYEDTQIEVIPYFTSVEASSIEDTAGQEPATILFLGRVAEVKGLDRLIRALRLVDRSCRLVVAGNGYSLAENKALAEKLNLTDRVEFLGWVGEQRKRDLLARSRLLVMPSVWPEPFGIAGIEAMAQGKPVIAFDVGGISDWLSDGETGYLVPADDEGALAERINHLLAHPELANKMGQNGREVVERRFDPGTHVASLLRVYRSALGRSSEMGTESGHAPTVTPA